MAIDETERPPHPRETCNFFTALTLGWTIGIFKLGFKRSLDINDVFKPLLEHDSAQLGSKFTDAWDKERQKNNPSLYKLIIKYFKLELFLYLFFFLVKECVIRVAQPLLLGRLISYYDSASGRAAGRGPLWAALGLVASHWLYVMATHPCAMAFSHLGLKFRVALGSLTFRKSLRLSQTAFIQTTVGQIVNLISNDMRRFDLGTVLLLYLIVSPIQGVILTYFIWREIGVSALFGVLFMISFIPFQLWMGKTVSKLRTKTAKLTDKRLQLTNEVISGIQVIKMFAWEERFNKLLNLGRKNEIKKIRLTSHLKGLSVALKNIICRLSLFISILAFVALGNKITAEKFFITICCYEILKQTMTSWFQLAIVQFQEMSATFRRLEDFLLRDECCKANGVPYITKDAKKILEDIEESALPLINSNDNHEDRGRKGNAMDTVKDLTEFAALVSNFSFKWESSHQKYTLKDIKLEIVKGSFVVICGPVGSGKSTLLYAILKELPCRSGQIITNGKISYASQEPWLFPGSIKENILFGSPMNKERYRRVCAVCALEKDFQTFPDGDATSLGERGATLSGGQRSRISLARAVYRMADIYLLDDPLSAVDGGVARQLVQECIVDFLKDKTVVLITHQLQYIGNPDHIFNLNNGVIEPRNNIENVILEYNNEENNVKDEKKTEHPEKDSKKVQSSENKEKQNTGTIDMNIYKDYMQASGTAIKNIILGVLFISTQSFSSGFDFSNKYWVKIEENFYIKNHPNDSSLSNIMKKMGNNVSSDFTTLSNYSYQINIMKETLSAEHSWGRGDFLIVCGSIVVALILTTLFRSIIFYNMAMKASLTLHDQMVHSITRATMTFFHTNPTGRILNRFSQDMDCVDNLLLILIFDVLQIVLQTLGIFIIVAVVNVYSIIPIILLISIVYYMRKYYIVTSTSVKRIEAIARSPVFSHLSASLQGVVTIRAMQAEEHVIRKFDGYHDLYSSATYMFMGTSRAFAYWVDLIISLLVTLIIVIFLLGSDAIDTNIGLAVTQIIGLTTVFQWGIRQAAELENHMTSVERIQEYINVENEAPLILDSDCKISKDWPSEGRIEFENVNLQYHNCGTFSLRDLSFSISPQEKIGVVGRTGAGKSSLINALLRLAHVDGKIYVDGVDTACLGLHTLRSKISVIPQEPVLFTGTMRSNLDPFDHFQDVRIWKALDQVELKKAVSHLGGLDCSIAGGGANFSVGERQLICLARAILQEHKIIVLDEATANVDDETDASIQKAICTVFSECTVITIAHRLNTIMDSDKVIVMDAGKIIEFDSPNNLLKNKNSVFSNMAAKSAKELNVLEEERMADEKSLYSDL